MKKVLRLYFKPEILSFAIFQICFFALMWTSKTLHLLYFEQNNSVMYFGTSYSVMALAGYFSFFIGHLCDRWGYRLTLSVGAALYSLGLILRIYPHSLTLAISSGLVAGLGASTALCSLRLWMVSLADDETTPQLVGLKSSTCAFGTALGCMAAGIFPGLLNLESNYRDILLYSGVGMGILGFTFILLTKPPQKEKSSEIPQTPWHGMLSLFRDYKRIALTTTILGITTGFYVSFISPYLPLIMKDKGLSLLSIGLSTASFSLIRFFVDPFIAHFVGRHPKHSLKIFIFAEILIAGVTGAFLLPISRAGFILLLLLRSCMLGFSAISEELIWIRLFPKARLGLLFGLNQSAFFIGDFLGGLSNGYLYKNFGLELCIWVVLFIMLVNAVLFIALFRIQNAHRTT
jgi:MFS family permease